MALDPELRALLEAMEQRAVARDAATRLALEAKIEEVRKEGRQGFAAASSQAGALNDKALAAIKTLGDGLAMHREAVERHAEDRERARMNAHVLPLKTSATSHEGRLNDHEKRIRAVEKR